MCAWVDILEPGDGLIAVFASLSGPQLQQLLGALCGEQAPPDTPQHSNAVALLVLLHIGPNCNCLKYMKNVLQAIAFSDVAMA